MKYYSIIIVLLVFLVSCSQQDSYRNYNGEIQGTTFSIKYEYLQDDLEDEIDSILSDVDNHFSTYVQSSMISIINRSQNSAQVDDLFIDLWEKCWSLNIATDGYFDPSLGPLLSLYDFDDLSEIEVDSIRIQEALSLTGMHLVSIEGNLLTKKNEAVQLNFNAVAQGYSVDLICDFFDTRGLINYMVEIGGEIRLKGISDRKAEWVVGIDKPISTGQRELLMKIPLTNAALATSGNYRKFKTINGRNSGHILNPKSGRSQQTNILSLSVIAPNCYTADGMATAFMNMKLDEIKEVEGDRNDISVIVVYLEEGDTAIYASPALNYEMLR